MGQAKNEMMRREDLVNTGMSVLVQSGAVKECEIHDGIFIDRDDIDAVNQAYAIGTNLVKKGDVDGTRVEFMGAIKEALDNAGSECPICANNRDRD